MFAEEPKQDKTVARKARVESRDAVGKVFAEGCLGSQPAPRTTGTDPRPDRPHSAGRKSKLPAVPPGIGDMMSYVRAARGLQDFAGDSTRWLRHFVVLTKAENIGENGGAQKFTMMEPSQGKFRAVDSVWLGLFWRRQDESICCFQNDWGTARRG